ncbi:tripartite tricarboxylate transporter substrate binding protein [Belnapia sp. T6]|uniref:Tripartite tricarboxylate transporter substrate binding protein n=1 Tax=Belnapia mucosa TaxID=2804532 RepID=A0ABS1UZS5_9PROT|nr:tripartite tricarboxylate transporter substrate binding protein [Belnapia mucosa]MBL6454965.1 tripartite tricarboxylate transporter substrate binding protein [Belnapia mucosa]
MRITRRRALGLLAAPALIGPAAGAEDWPSRPIRFVVPYPPGGPTDILGRVAAQRAGALLPQPVVVENRAGAGGSIGAEAVARAAPDGATFLVNASAHVIVPQMIRVPFDAMADFAPVTQIASVPLILIVTPSLPVRSVAELLAYARANPGRLAYASSSNGGAPHLAGEMFKLLAGVDLQHIPYRGSGQALPDLVAGNVQLMFDSAASSADLVREGRLRPLAVTTEARIPAFPDLPTIAEAGVPGYAISTWYGIWAPARTPEAITTRLQRAVAEGLAAPEAAERLAALGAIPVAESPERFGAFLRSEWTRYAALVRDAKIKAD